MELHKLPASTTKKTNALDVDTVVVKADTQLDAETKAHVPALDAACHYGLKVVSFLSSSVHRTYAENYDLKT